VLLLGSGGRTVYFGSTSEVKDYFESIGFTCPENENLADFFLDVISGMVPHKTNTDFTVEELFKAWNANAHDYQKAITFANPTEAKKSSTWISRTVQFVRQTFISAVKERTPSKHSEQLLKDSKGENEHFDLEPMKVNGHRFEETAVSKTELLFVSSLIEERYKQPRAALSDIDKYSLGMLPGHLEVLRNAFMKCDTEKNGFVTLTVFRNIILKELQPKISDDEIFLILRNLELDSKQSVSYKEVVQKIRNLKSIHDQEKRASRDSNAFTKLDERVRVSFFLRLLLLFQRDIILVFRKPRDICIDFLLLIGFSSLIGFAYGSSWGLKDFPVLLLLSTLSIGLLASNSGLKIFSNRLIFWKECSIGIGVTEYFLSKAALEACIVIIYPAVFSIVFYFTILPEFDFLTFFKVIILVHWSTSGIGMLLACILSPTTALLGSVLIPIGLGGFFSGLSPLYSSFTQVQKLISCLSNTRWAVEALLGYEFDALADHLNGTILFSQGFSPDQQQQNELVLFSMGLIYRILCYISLHTFNRSKRA
jgi:hypothetical protein